MTTSGTAVANLHPAVLEAAHSKLPLVVVSADRPHEMRGTGANQTTDQVGIFGSAPRYAVDLPAGAPGGPLLDQVVTRALAAAQGLRTNAPGPVHLNVALRDPLAPATTWRPGPPPAPRRVVAAPAPPEPARLHRGPRTVVVAGDGAGPAPGCSPRRPAGRCSPSPPPAPAPATTPSGPYRLLLAEPDAGRRRRARRPRRPPHAVAARSAPCWRAAASRWSSSPRGGSGPTSPAPRRRWSSPPPRPRAPCPTPTRPGSSAGASPARPPRRPSTPSSPSPAGALDGLLLARHVARAAGRSGGPRVLVAGSSNTVRDLDVVAAPWDPDHQPVAVANRGLAGIDGTVATATGLALGLEEPVRALMGDLTFLHDAGALLRGRLEDEVDLQVVVLNDGGGGIFATLEHGAPARAAQFERIFGTPQQADLAQLAEAYGARHDLVEDAGQLRERAGPPGARAQRRRGPGGPHRPARAPRGAAPAAWRRRCAPPSPGRSPDPPSSQEPHRLCEGVRQVGGVTWYQRQARRTP